MNLEKYIQSIEEKKKLKPLPIPVEELCQRYEALYTAAVNDVLREDGLLSQTLPNEVMPLRDNMVVCGPVFTIKSCLSLDISYEMEFRAKMLNDITPGSVVVWDTGGENYSAHWGEMMTKTAMKIGCKGAFVDGGIRDTRQILKLDFPIFYRYRTSNAMLGRTRILSYQIPVKIGSVNIFPGDIAFGDIDGCIIIPRDKAYDVLLRAEKIKRNEQEIDNWIKQGLSATEIVDRGGYF